MIVIRVLILGSIAGFALWLLCEEVTEWVGNVDNVVTLTSIPGGKSA